jgi:hypothetical protein
MPTAVTTKLAKLREPFTVDQVKQRRGGGKMLDYVPIETVLERLLTVVPDYSWEGHVVSFIEGTAIVEGFLSAEGKRAFGVGAMKNAADPDMAVKSANSEAIKNAAKTGFGVALELWDADRREELEAQRQGVVATTADKEELINLKNRVADIAVATGVERTGPAIAAHFGIRIEQLQDRDTLETIIGNAIVSAETVL